MCVTINNHYHFLSMSYNLEANSSWYENLDLSLIHITRMEVEMATLSLLNTFDSFIIVVQYLFLNLLDNCT